MACSGVDAVIITCEHGGNGVPPEHRALFASAHNVLATHRGYDIGALPIARALASALRAPLHESIITRLLIDLNRSLDHPTCFSEYSRDAAPATRKSIIRRYYTPYRDAVERAVRTQLARRHRVLHLSVHSFTPVLDGVIRTADIGLLYDPARWREKEFCSIWRDSLLAVAPGLRVRRNYPYQGRSDGLPTSLRRSLGSPRYLGIELEVNQALLLAPGHAQRTEAAVVESLCRLLKSPSGGR